MLTIQERALCQNLIDQSSSDIIQTLYEFINNDIVKNSITKDKEGKKQFNDFMEAAIRASSIAELELYIAYKGTKRGSEKIWKDLAKPTIDHIKPDGALKLISEQIKDVALKKHEQDLSFDDIHIEVVRRFAGYLMWKAHIMIEEKLRQYSKNQANRNNYGRGRNVQ